MCRVWTCVFSYVWWCIVYVLYWLVYIWYVHVCCMDCVEYGVFIVCGRCSIIMVSCMLAHSAHQTVDITHLNQSHKHTMHDHSPLTSGLDSPCIKPWSLFKAIPHSISDQGNATVPNSPINQILFKVDTFTKLQHWLKAIYPTNIQCSHTRWL